MTPPISSRCYACNAVATTREHVPPRGFYPTKVDGQLIVVPSCVEHNNANSLDVEYVRNVLIVERHSRLDLIGDVHDRVWRSFNRRSATLLKKTFHDVRPVIVDGKETGYFSLDVQRFKRVMAAMASGMYRHVFGRRFFGSWLIYDSGTMFAESLNKEKWEGYKEVEQALNSTPFEIVETPMPTIFECGKFFSNKYHGTVFRFRFFSGFNVWAVAMQPWYASLWEAKNRHK